MEILEKLSSSFDIYTNALQVFQLFIDAFGEDAFHHLGTSKGVTMSINRLFAHPNPSDLWEDFLNIKVEKMSNVYFGVKMLLHDVYGFLLMIESMSKCPTETFTNWYKETKTISGTLFTNLKNFVEDPDISQGHKPIPKVYSFNVDLETIAQSMLALIGKLSEKDLKLTDKGSNITIGQKLTPELRVQLSKINNNYFFPEYTKGERINFTITEEDFKNMEFRALFLQKGLDLKKRYEDFKKYFDTVYYKRR